MTSDKSISALRRHQKNESERKQIAVLYAIADFRDRGESITVSAISRTAEVSREFVYSHPPLLQTLSEAAEFLRCRPAERAAGVEGITSHELKADRRNLVGQVERQRLRIAGLEEKVVELERLRQRWLGAQLLSSPHIDPEVHSELRITSERITAENIELNRRVDELRRQVSILESELSASRQAHAEDAHAWSAAVGADNLVDLSAPRTFKKST